MASEVLPVVEHTPVLAGVNGTDPFYDPDVFLPKLTKLGFSGVQNFPTVGLIDGEFRANLEETGMGYQPELEMIRKASALRRSYGIKGAVLAMTRELAVVHARENIRVNALCPGPLKTDLLMKFLDTDEKKHRRLVHISAGRFGEAREMAQAALYLASDESSYVTGTEFVVDGGITSAYVTPE